MRECEKGKVLEVMDEGDISEKKSVKGMEREKEGGSFFFFTPLSSFANFPEACAMKEGETKREREIDSWYGGKEGGNKRV